MLLLLLLLLHSTASASTAAITHDKGTSTSTSTNAKLSAADSARHIFNSTSTNLTYADFSSRSAVIGVMSSVHNFHLRQLARNTYKQFMLLPLRLRVYFVIGMEGVSTDNEVFLVEENLHFDDLALLHGVDDAAEMPGLSHWKVLGFFKFALGLQHCYDYVVKADHDTYIHPMNLQRLLATLPATHAYWGHSFDWGRYRFNTNQSDIYSWYNSGGGYLISRDLIAWIVHNTKAIHMATADVWNPFEDLLSGFWVLIATSHMSQDREDLELAGIRDAGVLRGLKPLNNVSHNIQEALDNEWYNLDWNFQGAHWDDEWAEKAGFNEEAQEGELPLSTIVIHELITQERFLFAHFYFVRCSYYQWTACIHLSFGPAVCMQLLNGGAYHRSWKKLSFLRELHDDVFVSAAVHD